MIKVSVLLPVYNNKEDIIDAIKSVENQTYKDWELIIVDDCSTDGTYEIIISYIKNKPSMKLFRNATNCGVYVSLNEALLKANGKYICVLNSDDKFIEKNLELNVKILEDNPNFIAVISKMVRQNFNDNPRYGEITIFYRKKMIDEIGYYDSVRFAADSEFIQRIFNKYGKNNVYHLDIITYYAKLRQNSLTTAKDTKNPQIRKTYVKNFQKWHQYNMNNLYIPYPLIERKFDADPIQLP
jgi:glycosyltransferase involved in cell wall biosynthesis